MNGYASVRVCFCVCDVCECGFKKGLHECWCVHAYLSLYVDMNIWIRIQSKASRQNLDYNQTRYSTMPTYKDLSWIRILTDTDFFSVYFRHGGCDACVERKPRNRLILREGLKCCGELNLANRVTSSLDNSKKNSDVSVDKGIHSSRREKVGCFDLMITLLSCRKQISTELHNQRWRCSLLVGWYLHKDLVCDRSKEMKLLNTTRILPDYKTKHKI